MKQASTPQAKRQHRQARTRAKVIGTTLKPRLNVFRSNSAMFVQLIDDSKGLTLVSVHSKSVGKVTDSERAGKTAVAYKLGSMIAEKAKTVGVNAVVFDRGGYRYHGRVKAVAEGARAGGLTF